MPASVLVLKPCPHSTLSWSNVNTSFVSTFIFVIKLPRHFICIEVTSTLHPYWNCDNIYLCHEATTTLHLYWGHANIASLPLKLCQHSIFAEAMPTFIFAIEATSTLHFRRSHANVHFCHEATTTLHLYRGYANIASLPLKLRQHFICRSYDNIREATSNTSFA